MLIAVICFVLITCAAIVILLVLVAADMRRENPWAGLASTAPGPLAAAVRRLHGVYVCKPSGQAGTPDKPRTARGSDRPARRVTLHG